MTHDPSPARRAQTVLHTTRLSDRLQTVADAGHPEPPEPSREDIMSDLSGRIQSMMIDPSLNGTAAPRAQQLAAPTNDPGGIGAPATFAPPTGQTTSGATPPALAQFHSRVGEPTTQPASGVFTQPVTGEEPTGRPAHMYTAEMTDGGYPDPTSALQPGMFEAGQAQLPQVPYPQASSPQSPPAQASHVQTGNYAPPVAAMPVGLLAAPTDEDAEPLAHWLTRSEDEVPDARRGSVLTLCLAVMALSILAGYGGAQFVNMTLSTHSGDDAAFEDGPVQASGSLFSPDSLRQRVDQLTRERTATLDPISLAVPDKNEPVAEAAPGADDDDLTPAELEARTTATADGDRPARVTVSPLAPGSPTTAAPQDRTEPAEDAMPERRDPAVLAREEKLIARGRELLDRGDVAAARLVLRHLAEAGSAQGALMLAQAYDAEWLFENSPGSLPANRDMALRWYTMAAQRGETRAIARLETLRSGRALQ
ncbi:MAG: hypothetical protein AAFQ42_00705 [Pseudomonadota bacterium]